MRRRFWRWALVLGLPLHFGAAIGGRVVVEQPDLGRNHHSSSDRPGQGSNQLDVDQAEEDRLGVGEVRVHETSCSRMRGVRAAGGGESLRHHAFHDVRASVMGWWAVLRSTTWQQTGCDSALRSGHQTTGERL